MLEPSKLYTPAEVAFYFKVAIGSIYQSLPDAACRTKLGRKLPEPIRLGRLIRWTGQQLNEFVSPSVTNQITLDANASALGLGKRRPGRPRKVSCAEGRVL